MSVWSRVALGWILVLTSRFRVFRIKPLQLLYLPSSVIGGLVGLIVLQLCHLNKDFFDYVDREWISGWDGNAG